MSEDSTRLQAFSNIPEAPPGVLIRAIRGQERVSRPFWYEVDFESLPVEMDKLRGQIASIELLDDLGNTRWLSGAVQSIEVAASDEDRNHYRILLLPHLSMLKHRQGFRIFQEMTTEEIVKKVVEGAGISGDFLRWNLTGSYQPRTYCVQYDESEWDFICRLLEDEGIWFVFEHDASGHVMVLSDASNMAPAIEQGNLAHVNGPGMLHYGESSLWHWESRAHLSETKATVNDFDFERPSADITADFEVDGPLPREWYEYPSGYAEPEEGSRRAEVRLQELRSRARSAVAHTDAIDALPGRKFELLEHPFFDGEHFITGVKVHFRLHEQQVGGPLSDPGGILSQVELECVPLKQVYRPARTTPRPRIRGVQTAMVTGPAGEEIHCDEYGRVKVQFHWDRDGQLDEKTSCWIRTSQPHQTGAIMIPRIGWEVLVQFLEGDPDRPIVLGHFFNSNHPPDYDLPAQKTVSGHRSNSSPGAGGTNEVMFDDAAGSQLVSIGGHSAINIVAANNKTFQVGNNMGQMVGASRTVTIGANEKVSVEGDEQTTVGGSQTVTVGANRAIKVNAKVSESVISSIDLSVGAMEQLMVGSPISGVLDLVKGKAVAAAQGAAASAAERATGTVMGPIMPALNSAQQTIGPALQFAGNASSLLGAGGASSAIGSVQGALGSVPGAAQASSMASNLAGSAANGVLTAAGLGGGGSGGGGGGSGGGGGGGGGGNGTWSTTVAASMTEHIGAVAALSSAGGIAVGIGGSSTESIGAARMELIKGGKNENVKASKTETVGSYIVKASDAISVNAKGAIAETVASLSQKIGGGHSISADGAVAITASTLNLKASGAISLVCGAAKVVIDSAGIHIAGPAGVTVQATGIIKTKKSPAILPGL